MVHDTGGRFKTAPEGRFDIPVERDTDNKSMNINQGLLEGISFIRDKGSESGTPVKVKRTAAELTKQRAEDIGTKQEFLVKDVYNAWNAALNEALAKAAKGSSLTDMQIRSSTEGAFQDKFNEMILNDQHVQVQAIIDRAQGKGPNGESIPPMLVGGERVSPQMITNLQRAVWAQENRLATTDPERSEVEEKALKDSGTRLSRIAAASPDISLEDTNKAIAKDAQEFEAEALEKGWSQDTKNDYYKQVAQLKDRLSFLGAGTRWNGLYLTPDFLANLDQKRDDRGRFKEQLQTQSELLRVAQTEGIDLSDLQISNEEYSYLSKPKQIQWDTITNGLTHKAMQAAAPEAIEELALLYQNAGERDFEKDILVPDQDEDGKEIEGQQVRAGVLYQKLLRKHMTKKLTELISDTKERKKLINEAARIKGRTAAAAKDLTERRVEARKLEEELGRTDFLDNEGRATRQYGDRDYNFSGNDGNFIDRWVLTAESSDAIELMGNQTEPDTLASALENVTGRVNKAYLRSAAVKVAENNHKPLKQQELLLRLKKQIKYTGVPMSTHEEGMLVKGTYQSPFTPSYVTGQGVGIDYGVTRSASRMEIDLNKDDLYSNPETAKTHVYSFYATREAGYKDPENKKLRQLYNIYFKGQETSYSVEQFIADQTELGKQLKIISSK